MKINIKVDIKPLKVPTQVHISKEGNENFSQIFFIRDLNTETIEQLCEEFTNSVFEESGKRRPLKEDREPFLTYMEAKAAIKIFDTEWVGQDPSSLWNSAVKDVTSHLSDK